MSENEGIKILTEKGLTVESEYVEVDDDNEINYIIGQSIEENKKVKKGTSIKIKIAKEKVNLINVVGLSKDETVKKLQILGLKVKIVEQFSDEVEVCEVISQKIEDGTMVNKGIEVEIVVSKGVDPSTRKIMNI